MTEPLEPISNAAMPRVTDTAIICGNCCGDAEAPRLIFETEDKTCAGCGGRIYVVAPKQLTNDRGPLTDKKTVVAGSQSSLLTDERTTDQ